MIVFPLLCADWRHIFALLMIDKESFSVLVDELRYGIAFADLFVVPIIDRLTFTSASKYFLLYA
jgi:hypothetical protein